jgi:hypothetical protein
MNVYKGFRILTEALNKWLDGRSLRLKKKWDTVSETEVLILNEPCYQEEDAMERVDKISKQGDLPLDEKLLNRLVVGFAIKAENNIILIFKEKRVTQKVVIQLPFKSPSLYFNLIPILKNLILILL